MSGPTPGSHHGRTGPGSTERRRLGRLLQCWAESALLHAFACSATAVYRLMGDRRGWRPVLTRTGAHLAIVASAALVVATSRSDWSARAAAAFSASAQSAATAIPADEPVQATLLAIDTRVIDLHSSRLGDETAPIARLAQPHTIVPVRPRLGVITYTVQAGDTIQGIAALHGLQPTSIQWANPEIEDAPDLLRIGQQITILPIDGVYHIVEEGDTLDSIAEEYKASVEEIVGCTYNSLASRFTPIQTGIGLIVPGGEKPYVPKVVTVYEGEAPQAVAGTGQFQWPVVGVITQGYWYGHRAVDVGAPTGSALLAADDGFISFAGWTDVGYGYLVVINHNNGYSTYYAHCSNIYVYEGQTVDRGQVIAAVGSTGWSTGPHLHFEVRYQGVQQNPFAYLP